MAHDLMGYSAFLFCFLVFSPGLDLNFDGGLTSQLGKPRPVLCA